MADDKHRSEAFGDARLLEAAQLLQTQHPEFESLGPACSFSLGASATRLPCWSVSR